MPSPVPVVVDDAAAEAMLAECGAEFGGHVKKVIKALIQSDPEQAFKVFEVVRHFFEFHIHLFHYH